MIVSSDCHRKSREYCRDFLLQNRQHLPLLLKLALDTNQKFHYKACWILELIIEADVSIILPYIDIFSATLPNYKHDGALRSVSRICLMILTTHVSSTKIGLSLITEKHVTLISEICFCWLIEDQKVATKVYAMRTLYEISKLRPAITAELKEAIVNGYADHSAGYKAASKDILRQMSRGS